MTPEERAEKFKIETIERNGRMCWPGTVYIAAAIRDAVAEERERCAKIAGGWRTELLWEDYDTYYGDGVIDVVTGDEVAAAIRKGELNG